MSIFFTEVAKIELIDAVDYYNLQSEGLGFEFAVEVQSTLERIESFPESWPDFSKHTKRARTKRFPYGVLYSIENNDIWILSVMHLHRDPQQWESKVK